MTTPADLHPDGYQSPVDVDNRGRVFQTLSFSGGVDLLFRAEKLRQERGTVHARIAILLAGSDEFVLAWDDFNVEKASERQWLANRAHQRLGKTAGNVVTKDLLGAHFDAFCEVVWPARIAATKGGWTMPASERTAVSLLTPWLPLGGGAVMFAPPGSAKTFIGIVTAISVQYAIDTLWDVRQANVLYVNLERSEESMRRRLLAVEEAIGIEPLPLLMLHRRGASMTDIEDAVAEMVVEHGVELVIWDSLSRFGGGTLVDDAVMNRAMDMCNRTSPTWNLIAHSPRADSSHAFGSIMQDAAADVMVQVASETLKDLTVGAGLMITKANDIPTGHVGTFAFGFDRTFGLQSIRKARPGEFVMIEGSEPKPAKQRILDYVLHEGARSATAVSDALHLSRETVSRAFGDPDLFVPAGADKTGKLYGAAHV